MIRLGQTVRDASTGRTGLVVGLATFLNEEARAQVQRSFSVLGDGGETEWVALKRLTPLSGVLVELYCELDPGQTRGDTISHTV